MACNSAHTSRVDASTNVAGLLWTYTLAGTEVPIGPPVVSGGGYIWFIARVWPYDPVSYLTTIYLYCLNSDGSLKSKRALQTDIALGDIELTGGYLTVTNDDKCHVSYYAKLEQWDTDSLTPVWTYSPTISDSSYRHMSHATLGRTGEVIVATRGDDGNWTLRLLDISAGSVTSSIATGFTHSYLDVLYPTIDASGIYFPLNGVTIGGVAHACMIKYAYDGTLLWQYDIGTDGADYADGLPPSVDGDRLYFVGNNQSGAPDYGSTNQIFCLNASTGAEIWVRRVADDNLYTLRLPPSIDTEGDVYSGVLDCNGADELLRRVSAVDGTTTWTYAPASPTQSRPVSPVIGNDGYALWADGDVFRVKLSDGTAVAVTSGIFCLRQPVALVPGFMYAGNNPNPGTDPGAIIAYEVTSNITPMQTRGSLYEVRAYNSSDERVYLPVDWIDTVSFEITERGGFGQGSLHIIAPWEALPNLLGDERIDVWLWNVLVYRGWINVHQRDIDNPEQFSPQLAGLIETLNRWVIDRRYVSSQPEDISTYFGRLVQDYVLTDSATAGVMTDSQAIGATLQVFDARGETLASAFNRLCDQSPNAAIWGHDTDSNYNNRLYLRPRATAISKRLTVGEQVQAYAHPYDTGSVRNVLRLCGGQVAQPNLVANGSFENPLPPSETVGNLVVDYSFEDDAAAWSGTSSGSRKQTGGGGDAMGAPRSGSWWYEIDQNGEKAEQTVSGIAPTLVYTASAWVRREDATIPRTFTYEVEGLDGSNTVMVTIPIATALDPGGGRWTRYSGACDFSGYPTVEKAQIRIRAHAGSASNDGILIDDVAFYERDSVANAEWAWSLHGAATRVTLDWHATDVEAYHGGYCVKMLTSGIAGSSDYMELRTTKTARISVKPGQSYVVAGFIRGDGSNSVSASIGVSEWKADDTSAGADTESATMSGNLATWTLITATFTAAAGASTAEVWLRDRANTILYADAFALIETALPVDWYSGGYWEGDTYERVWDTNIIPPTVPGRAPVGLSASASASIATWGRREAVVQNDQVVDEATGQAFAIGWLNAHAVPQVSAQLRLTATQSEDLIGTSGTIRLLNLPSAPDALFPSRIRYTIDGNGVEIEVDLGSQRPELVEMIRVLAGKRASGELPAV
jgi:hypothetical protein